MKKPKPTKPEEIASAIQSEKEWEPKTAYKLDEIKRRFGEQVDAIAEQHPERLAGAIAVVVQAGPGKTCLVISDPTCRDFVAELTRYAQEPESDRPPLFRLLQERVPI